MAAGRSRELEGSAIERARSHFLLATQSLASAAGLLSEKTRLLQRRSENPTSNDPTLVHFPVAKAGVLLSKCEPIRQQTAAHVARDQYMFSTLQGFLLLAGVILFVFSLFRGTVRIKDYELPALHPGGRWTVGSMGAAFIVAGIWLHIKPSLLMHKPQIVERAYTFKGPLRIGRTRNELAFVLTDVAHFQEFANREVQVISATATLVLANENKEAFELDQDILMFGPAEAMHGVSHRGGTYSEYVGLQQYIRPRRLFGVRTMTAYGRAHATGSPIQWTVIVPDGHAIGGEIRDLRDHAIKVDDGGLRIQLFMWTLWEGDHFLDIQSYELKLRMKVT
jgi:hypothetical protein